MGQKDLSEKILADYNDVFADIVNVLLFSGEQRIQPEDLVESSVHSQYKADDSKLHEQERDVSKLWKSSGTKFAIFGLENQTGEDAYMPVRVLGYDGALYRSQLSEDEKNIAPVVTIVLHFGTERRWTKSRSLLELLDVPEGLEEYVNDYRITVFDVAWLTEEQLAMFQSDFGIVANFFAKKRKNKGYEPDDTRVIKHVDEVLKLLSVMSGDDRYANVLARKKEVRTMCDVAERLERRGIEKGLEAGRREGRREGIQQTLVDLVEKGCISISVAAEQMGVTEEEFGKYL